ncbi:peroxiredoxin family protein [Epilithonimonas sp.]|uniref:peroxiredoxin family protein n=1 Tax=Epilithonimonas sp. TaxID=2894511 RepID=UPI0028980554|nr:thioredoxin-like domain-containing protein [Epilithonimonas sp.]
MKKLLIICSVIMSASFFSQFTVAVDLPAYYSDSDIYLYGFNGSKENLYSKAKTSNNKAIFKVDKKYIGMMRAFFQKNNSSINMVSENKNIEFTLKLDDKSKITDVVFNDQTNQIFSKEVDLEKKKDLILPALIQIKDYYNPSDGFYKSLEGEIALLSQKGNTLDNANHPFLSYYQQNQRFSNQENASQFKQEDYLNFFSKSSEYLETSLLLKPALINYLNASKSNVEGAVDKLLETVNIETPRGQTILSELIDIFNTYNMDKLKDKYLTEANNLKCTINDRLASTLKSNNSTSIGQKMPNAIFVNPIHTKAKSLYDIKSSKKIVVFWSSTCSHCEAELPKILEKYEKLKTQNIAVVGFSLDSNLDEFRRKANNYPWISDSEGKGWYSSYGETYNINATPTYFILDADNKIISKPNHVADVLEYLKVN